MHPEKLIRGLVMTFISMSSLFATNAFTVTGGDVVSNYWNASNTGGTASVEALVFSNTVKIFISVDGGANVLITGGESAISFNGSTVNINLTAANIESAGSLTDGETFNIIAVFYNGVNVADTITLTTSAITVNQSAPTVDTITSTTADGDYSIGQNVNITITFSEAVTLSDGGELQVTLQTGGLNRTVTISSISNSTTASGTYTVQTNDASSDLSAASPLTLSGNLLDLAGNSADLNIITNLSTSSAIVIDGVVPAAVNLASGAGTALASGGNVAADYWNGTNNDLIVTIPLPGDASLVGGSAQIKGYWGIDVNTAQNLGSASSIGATGNKPITISRATLEAFGGYVEGGVLKVVALVTDKAGNTSTVGTESDDEITVDEIVPTISSLTSTTPDGYVIPTETVNVTLTFSEAVTLVGNNLQVELETGDTDQTLVINAFSASTTASGTYTVQENNASSDLTVKSVSLLGGSLRDAAGNDGTFTLPTTSNLADNSALVVDGVLPTITSITSTTANGDYAIGDNINVTIAFSEAVTLAGGTLSVPLDAGQSVTISSINNSTSASGTYTVVDGDASSDLSVVSPLTSSGTLKDAAGNAVDLATIPINIDDGSAIVIDGNIPAALNLASSGGTVIATGGTVVADYWNSTNGFLAVTVPIPVDASLVGGSYQVKGYWSSNVNDALNLGSAQSIGSSGNKTYSIPAATFEAFGGYVESGVLKIVATVTDKAGNTSVVGTESDNEITVDETVPTISSLTSTTPDGYVIPTDAVNVTLTYSEAVTLVGNNLQVEMETGGTDETFVINAFSSSATASGTYTVQVNNASSDLTVKSVSLLGGSLRDDAGNDGTFALPPTSNLSDNSALVVDGVIPSITSITSTTANGDYAIGEIINVTIAFSEAVTLAGGNLSVPLDAGQSVTISSISNSTSASGSYTVVVGDASSDLSANSPLTTTGTLRDIAGNDVDLATIPINIDDGSAIVVDGNIPSAINLASGAGTAEATGGTIVADYWNSTNDFLAVTVPIPVDASLVGGTFQLKGYWSSDVNDALNLGSAQSIGSSGNKTYSIPAATLEAFGGYTESGVLKLVVTATDKAGNTSAVGTESDDEITIDETAPTISSITSTTPDGYVIPTDAVNVTVTFSEAVTLVGNNLQVVLETGSTDETLVINSFASSASASGTYTVQQNHVSSDLTVKSVSLLGGSLRDAAGNGGIFTLPVSANLADNSAIVVDGVLPTILSITSTTANGDYAIGENINVTVTFSETVNLSGGNLLIDLDLGQTVTISTISNSTTGIGTYTVIDGDASDDLSVDSPLRLSGIGTLKDLAGNNVNLVSIPTNIDDGSAIVIDGNIPATLNLASGAGTVIATGGTVVADFWNNTNTFLAATVTIPADLSLVGGTIQIKGYWSNDVNDAQNLWGAQSITGTGGKTVSIPAATLEAFGGYVEAGVLKLVATVTDKAGNTSTVGTESDDEITIDETAPSISSFTSTSSDGYVIPANDVNVTVTFSEAVTLVGNNLEIELETGTIDETLVINAFSSSTTASGTYTVQENNVSLDLTVKAVSLLGGSLRDAAGNNGVFTLPGSSNLADNSAIVVDGVIPTIVSVTSSADDSDPFGKDDIVDLIVTFSEAVSLSVGEILVLDINSSTTNLQISSISNTSTATVNYTVLENDASTDLSVDGISLNGGGTLRDAAGNDVSNLATLTGMTNLDDANDFVIDGILPLPFTMSSATTTGGNIVAGYWNQLNEGLSVVVNIPDDASLQTGSLQIKGRVASNALVSLGTASTILATNTTKTVLVDDSVIEGMSGFEEGETFSITALVTDVAGNSKSATLPYLTLDIDRVAPTITTITSTTNDGSYSVGQNVNITINLSEEVSLASGVMSVTLNTVAQQILTDNTISEEQELPFTLSVTEGVTANPLTVVSVSATSGQLLDVAGNEVNFSLPFGENLGDNSTIVIDGEFPTIVGISTTVVSDTLGLGETVDIELEFNEALTLSALGSLDVLFDTGQTVSITSISASSTAVATYTVGVGEASTDLTVQSITLSAGTLEDAAGNDLDTALPAGENLGDNNEILVDGIVPLAFSTGNILTIGAPVVTGYWNLSNTGVEVILPNNGSDASLNGGTAHLEARLNSNDFAALGATETVGTNPVTLSLSRAQLAGIAGYGAGGTINIRGVLTDLAGNASAGTASIIALIMDQVAPTAPITGTLTVTGGNEYQGYWNPTNLNIEVSIPLDDDNTLIGGSIQLESDLNSASSFAVIGADSSIITDDGIHLMNVSAAEITTYGAGDGDVMSFRAVLTDQAGNETIGTIGTNTITVDYTFPASNILGTIIAVGNSVVDGYFNSTNTSVDVTILIEDDVTFIGGQIQLRATVDAFAPENILAPHTILNIDDVILSVPRADLTALPFYGEARVITFDAIVTDVAGNATNFDFSADELVIDEVSPVANVFTELVPLGDYSRAGYWNADNSALQISIPIDTGDPTLIDGHIKMAGNIVPGDGNFETYSPELAIGSLVATQTFTLPKADLETATGFTDGLTIEFRYIISDIAGNETVSATSVTTLIIDQTLPAAPDINEFTIKGQNITPRIWNATSDSLLLTIPINTVADPTLVDGFIQVQMSVGTTFSENSYYAVLTDSFSIPTADDTIRIAAADLEALPDYDEENLYTRILIQDRAGNETIGTTSTDVILIDTNGPAPFTCGPLISTGGVSRENAYNNSNTGISLNIPIANDASLLNGRAIIRVGLENLITLPPVVALEPVDTVSISEINTTLSMTLDHATLSGLSGFGPNFKMIVSADLLDVAGNQVEGTQSPNELIIDFDGPALPVVTDTTTVGGTIVAGYWNASNTGVNLTILTPVVADTSLLGGYIQITGRIGGDPAGTLVDSIPIVSINITEIIATIDAVDLEALSLSTEGQPIDLRIKMVDGRGNDTLSAWLEDILIMDQIAPALSSFNPAGTTTDTYITFDDTLKADWQDFTDAVSDVAYYDFSIGHTVGIDDFLAWDSLLTTSVDTLMTYTHADEYFLNVRAMDFAGNISEILSTAVITADLVLPVTTSAMDRYYFIDDWPGSLSGTFIDELSGIDNIELTIKRDSDNFYWDGSSWDGVDTTAFDLVLGASTWNFPLLSDSLANREEYIMTLVGSDIAGNIQSTEASPLVTATLDTFQFVINTAPLFVDRPSYIDSSDEDDLFARIFVVEDPDLTSISGDTLYYSLNELAPAGVAIESLTGELTWLPVDSAVGLHTFPIFVEDFYGERDTTNFQFTVIEVNDAPEPVTLLLPVDSTQLVPTDGLELSFKWTTAFDIEDNPVTYRISMRGTDYDTTLSTADTSIQVDVSVMDFPSSTIEWFVRALDQADTSAIADTFHVTTSSAFASLNTDSIAVNIERMTSIDTSFTMSNLGLTDLRWSLLSAPSWIDLASESGTIVYDTSSVIAFNVNPSAFTVGGYGGQFRILTNDPLQDTSTVKVTLDIFDVPTPVIAFYKNRAYPAYYEMMIVDSLGMIESLTVSHSGLELEFSTIDTFSYVAIVEVAEEGLNSFEVFASNWVGDTTITVNVTVSLIKRGSRWLARSPDDQFEIKGGANSVLSSSRIAILDSLLSANDKASYKVLTDGMVLAEPVLVSMPTLTNDQAIYIMDVSGDYVELPSVSTGEQVSAWAATLGAFKLGPRTIIVPENSSLSQNYPNPFNPTTTIDFDIGFLDGLNQEVGFSIYNIRGQEVRNLMETQMQPGSYSLIWNGLDDQGKQVSSGIYFARLMTGKGYAKTVKMLVLR